MKARFAIPVSAWLFVSPPMAQGQDPAPKAGSDGLAYAHVYADEDGGSHFADETFDLSRLDIGGALADASRPVGGEGLRLFCFDPGTRVDWHPAPRPQLYVILAGDIIVATATEGRGVRARWDQTERSCVGIAPLVAGFPGQGADR